MPPKDPQKLPALVDDDDDAAIPAPASPASRADAGKRRGRSAPVAPTPAVLLSVQTAAKEHFNSAATSAAASAATSASDAASPICAANALAAPRLPKSSFEAEAEKIHELCQKHAFLTEFEKSSGKPHPDVFKSCRKDLPYTVYAFCNLCDQSGRPKHNCFFGRAAALADHILKHAAGDAAPVAAAGDALRLSVRLTFALWASSCGLAECHLRRFGELFGCRLSIAPLPAHQCAIANYERVVMDAADGSDACAKRLLKEQPFAAVSIDGARWQHQGQYMLVTVVHTPKGMFVLRPHTSETPYNGASIAASFITTLHAIGAPILHAMVDGCTANEAGLKGVELLAQELAAVDLDSDDDEAAGEGAEDNDKARRSALEALAETLRDADMLRHATRYPVRLLCIPHWLKNRVLDLHKTLKTEAITVVGLLAKALFDPHAPSVRKRQLRRFIRAKRVALTRQETGSLLALADDIGRLLGALRSEDLEGAEETLITAKASLLKEIGCIGGDGVTAAVIESLSLADLQGTIDQLTTAQERLRTAAAAAKTLPRAVRIATSNQTRWHSSMFASFAFLHEYLAYVKEFFEDEDRQTSASAKELHQTLADEAKFALITKQLSIYTVSLEPLAALMTTISDVSAARPLAHKMHFLYEQMRKKLAQQPADTPGKLLAATLDQYEAGTKTDAKFSTTLETFWYIKLFVPGSLVGRGPTYKRLLGDLKLRASHVRVVLGFTESEFPEAEWELWNGEERENVPGELYLEYPSLYWASEGAKAKFPTLHKAALYLLSLPVAVTSCDSVISVMGASFSSRQNALSTDKASAVLALRCNGDIDKRSLDPAAFPRWGGNPAL